MRFAIAKAARHTVLRFSAAGMLLALCGTLNAAPALQNGASVAPVAATAAPARLDPLPQTEVARARTDVNAILARREFQAAAGPSWWDVQVARFWSWLGRFFSHLDKLGRMAPWLGTAMEWTLFVGAAVGLLVFIRRSFARQRLRVSLSAGASLRESAWERESEDWARLAAERAAAKQWRDAVHCLYWAAIVLLESRRAWRHNPSRTPREYVRLLRPGSAQQRALRGLTRIFERTWYGLREADESDFREARSFFDQVSAPAAGESATSGPTIAAGTEVRA